MDELVLNKKLKMWQNKLLDLSKRNRMISFKDGSSQVVRLLEPGFDELYETLVIRERSLTIKTPIDKVAEPTVYAMVKIMHSLGETLNVGKGDIRTSGTLESSARIVKNIKKYANLSLQEKGTNILYLSFGFIYWRERNTNSGSWLKAPLILVPAELYQSSLNQPFSVKRTDEDIIVNPTFAYYIEMNYGIKLPSLKSTNGLQDVYAYFEQVSSAIEKLGWHIEPEVYLSTMSFLKTNMYNDLVENESKILAHPIIRAFAGEQNEYTTLPESSTDFNHDSTDVENVYEVLNADSSQKDAVELAHRGISFVMQGPPGTGKSQTIANIISQGIAEGKKILFVSEKQAALDVVYRRLSDVGIGALCLPLHDPKTNKQVVIKQLEKNLDASDIQIGNDLIAELHQLDGLKNDLKAYTHILHERVEPFDMSLYEAYEMLFSLGDIPNVIYSFSNISSVSRSDMNRMIREITEYETTRDLLGEKWYSHPWFGVKKKNLSIVGKQQLKESVEQLVDALSAICSYEITTEKKLSDVITWDNANEYEKIGRTIASLPIVPAALIVNSNSIGPNILPNDLQCIIQRIIDFYGNSDIGLLKTVCSDAQIVFSKLSSVLGEELSAKLNYLQIFQFNELLYQVGLDPKTLSVTQSYFSSEGIKQVYDIKDYIKDRYNRVQDIKKIIATRYKEGVLNIDLNVTVEELPDLISQIYFSNQTNDICSELETNFGVRLVNKTNIEEIVSVVGAIADGKFDCFLSLTDNEFFFVYELLEEAQQKQASGDNRWFEDYSELFNKYLGENYSDEYLILANDFYYVKNTYPELLTIANFSETDKTRVQNILNLNGANESLVTSVIDALNTNAISNSEISTNDMCEDIKLIFEYQGILKEIENSYVHNMDIIGNQYLMASTDWDLIERNVQFAGELRKQFNINELEGIKSLALDAFKLDWSEINSLLIELISLSRTTPTIEKLVVGEASDILRSGVDDVVRIEEGTTDWIEICDAAKVIRKAVLKNNKLIIDEDVLRVMLSSESKNLFDMMDLICGLSEQVEPLQTYLDAYEDPGQLRNLTLTLFKERLEACLSAFSGYDTMVEYQICSEHCKNDGLNAFIAKAYDLRTSEKTLGLMLQKSMLSSWVDWVSSSREIISAFSSRVQNNRIDSFKKLDTKQLKIARKRVLATSYSSMPKRSAGKVVGEMGILLREISKTRNAMSIRQLFNSIPNLLLTLKPCLMMSPLSVAYFLKSDLYSFDMVIFDEASQIFPENAIGAILRGKQVIISGDSKQMPPTNFFHTSVGLQDEDDEEDYVAAGDSILEESENFLPNLSLTWHYRSRNESLITFSNRNMYSGSLVSFPNNAPNLPDTGVELNYIEHGIYENRCNEAEAAECVALTIEHFHNHPDRSIGIIAFSISQEECIERAFDEFRKSNPQYEEFFKETRENPFFIKNLENVQGDERDTILLSVGYARNAQGVLRYNFGPLGMQGGERRMNVAITRAKYNIKLVTSLQPEDFDRSKTQTNAGAKLLYDYIVYAKYGINSDSQSGTDSVEDGFKRHIVKILNDAGYTTRMNIGNSGYKVEIAVERPGEPGNYMVGIETDGHAYSLARTVRDRESLRPDMLRSMGWNIYRIWSTQWIRDPETEKQKLLQFVSEHASLVNV